MRNPLEEEIIITALNPSVDVRSTGTLAGVTFEWSDDSPVHVRWGERVIVRSCPLAEVFTTTEQRARTSVGYVRSAVGARLRHRAHAVDGERVRIEQADAETGLAVISEIVRLAGGHGASSWRITQTLRNEGEQTIVLTAPIVATAGIGGAPADLDGLEVLHADSEWLAEGRWASVALRSVLPDLRLDLHGQDARGRFARSSRGGWSTGGSLPVGAVVDPATGDALAWQVESSSGWVWELTQGLSGAALALAGPTDSEHAFLRRLEPGDSFTTVPVVLAAAGGGRDGAFAALTAARRATLTWGDADRRLPIVYNDFMNTLMGDPTAERLQPLIDAAADAGAEVFCIDAGWFAPRELGPHWWSTVGEWREAGDRFPGGGLRAVFDRIRAGGMAGGLWLEPEVIGIDSPAASTLPDDAFLQRGGVRVCEDHRHHLDFRHPAARAHLDETVDRLIADYGVSYLKLDYNIDPGPGTDVAADSPGDGLLGHVRAYREWLLSLRRRHPGLLVENCASGAMRMDHALVGVVHQQSTSDQQDAVRYTPIAASAPAALLPEQAANWAYPSAAMTEEETVLTLANGLSGRFYLAGFLNELTSRQRQLVHEAVRLHGRWRSGLMHSVPFWPLGLPAWEDGVIALGLREPDRDLVIVWNRGAAEITVLLPGVAGRVEETFPESADGCASVGPAGLQVRLPAGPTARVLRVLRAG